MDKIRGFSIPDIEFVLSNLEEDDKAENKGQLGPTSKLSAHIKKYIFNSSISNVIYSIGILDFKKQS